MSVADILRRARARIEDPSRWTQGAFARDAKGVDMPASCASEGVCFCAVGAIYAEIGDDMEAVELWNLLDRAAADLGFHSAPYLNDTADHPAVLRLYDLAIAKAEGGAP
ncbi:MAG TPA: hypothetical protein VLT47_11150 [Anaeromyxobacteraceae bacterium]|nr:hypothetical protein [Anaeromyxobacteraceae bacterium]